jgi:hypothetical protein
VTVFAAPQKVSFIKMTKLYYTTSGA